MGVGSERELGLICLGSQVMIKFHRRWKAFGFYPKWDGSHWLILNKRVMWSKLDFKRIFLPA